MDIFQKIIDKEIPAQIVYEDENFIAFLDIKPNNPGHTLLVPKKFSTNILDTDDQVLSVMAPLVKKIAKAVMIAGGYPAFNLGANNNPEAGQVVMRTHWHIIPRKAGDGLEMWHGHEYEPGEIEIMAQKIRDELK